MCSLLVKLNEAYMYLGFKVIYQCVYAVSYVHIVVCAYKIFCTLLCLFDICLAD